MFAIIALSAVAHAGLVEAWSVENFPREGEIAGWEGWENGYDGDGWGSERSDAGSWAYSLADHAPSGGFGDGGAYDNWLVNAAEPVKQGTFETVVYPTDNDAFGVVVGHDRDRYYLLLVCGEEDNDTSTQSCPVSGLDTHATALVQVRGSRTEVLDSTDVGARTYQESEISITMDNGVLTATIGRVSLSTEVEADFQLDGVGFYAFNEGLYDESGESDGDTVYFRNPVLSWMDEDDDDVVDDLDNCESVANRDQADADGDGIGTACDDAEELPDTGGEDTAGTDTGDTGGGGGGGKKDNGPIIVSEGQCGCAAGTGSALPGLLGLGVAAVALRRRFRD
jgi:hypothetical protein